MTRWLIRLCCVSLWLVSQAYAQAAPRQTFVEQLTDQSWIIEVKGVAHRCLPPAQVRELLHEQAELNSARAQLANLRQQVAALETERDALRRERELTDRLGQNFSQQIALLETRLNEQRQLLEKALPLARRSRLARFFAHPATTTSLAVLLPIVGGVLGAR